MGIFVMSCEPKKKDIVEFDPRVLEENGISLSEIADDINYIPLDNIFPLGLIHNNFTIIDNSIYFSSLNIGILEYSRCLNPPNSWT